MELNAALEILAAADKEAMAAGDLNAYRSATVADAANVVLGAKLPENHVLYVSELLWGNEISTNDTARYALSA